MNENTILKMNLLGGMDAYARDNFDEELFEVWLEEGVPDGADEETLQEIVEMDGEFERICRVFGSLLR